MGTPRKPSIGAPRYSSPSCACSSGAHLPPSAGWRHTSGSGKPRSRMEFQESQAIYLQIADMLCENVLRGSWKPGDRVPSIRELAESIAVNPNTVVRAYSYLQDHGIIYNQR